MKNNLTTELIHLTDSAIKQINKLQKQHNNFKLRVSIISGGCNGLQYYFSLDKIIYKNDRVFNINNANVIIDCISLEYLQGSSIDYLNNFNESKFIIFNNPNMKYNCSCGYSFSI